MVPISKIIADHAALAAKLRGFSFASATQFAASLSLLPGLHGQTIRLEALQHLAVICAGGTRVSQRDDLAEWAGQHMLESPLRPLEDPVEDVFVGSANSPLGSFKVLMGICSDADFWIEKFLQFVSDKQNFPPFEQTVKHVLPLLKLSEELVNRAGLPRYCEGKGSRNKKIEVPRWRDLQRVVGAVLFSDAELSNIGITRTELNEFILTEEQRADLPKENLWNSTLERRPLIEVSNGICVALPSSLGRAAIRFLTESITGGLGGWADTFFATDMASMFVNQIANRLEIRPIQFQEPPRPAEMPPLYPFFGQFDFGRPAILLTYCPSLVDAVADLGGVQKLTESEQSALEFYLQACAKEFENMPGFSGGLILVSLGQGLRTCMLGLNEWSPRWRIHICTLPEWLLLTANGECNAMRLWKLGDHEALIESNGTRMLNVGGLPNLFAAWKSNGFRLLPRSQDPRELTMVSLDCTFVIGLYAETRQKLDFHCVQSHSEPGWVKLRRYNGKALFVEDTPLPMYVDGEAINRRQLVGCVKGASMLLWIVFQGFEGHPEHRSVAFKLWECIFHWMARIAPIAAREWQTLDQLRSIEIVLVLTNLENWSIGDHKIKQPTAAKLLASVDSAQKRIIIEMPEDFLDEFHSIKNTAEQSIVDAILASLSALAGARVEETHRKALVREIVRNDDARYFHVVRVRRIEQHFADPGSPDPLLITDEDYAFSQLGLAHCLGLSGNGEISGLEQCKSILKEAVSKVWERIEFKLKRFERKTVVFSCLHQLDELSRDEERWDMSTRSSFALHGDRSKVHEVLLDIKSKREQATVSNRLLIETAQYACHGGSDVFTQADHLSLLADMSFLLMLAHHRDALAYGFLDPKIQLFPNGEINVVDQKFYDGVFGQYMTKRAQERAEAAAADYDEYFAQTTNVPSEDSKELDQRIVNFNKFLIPEFGFPLQSVLTFLDAFREIAVEGKQSAGEIKEAEIMGMLNHAGFSAVAAQEFLTRFTLPIRKAWNADLPPLCKEADVFPWRFRRKLSLFYRPLIEISAEPRSWILSVPALEKGLMYRFGHIERGTFAKDHFRSREMQQYVGNIVNKRGHDFTRKVADVVRPTIFLTEKEVEMTKLGASKKDQLGDIDVLAWDPASAVIFAIECKRLLPAITVREVIQRLEDFRGNREDKDSLGRHLRRVDWLRAHFEVLKKYTKLTSAKTRLVPLLVTSETVPMQFFSEMDFPTAQVVPFDELQNYITRVIRST